MNCHTIQQRHQGSILVVMMVISAVIGLTLISVMTWAQQEHQSTIRSKAWNAALPLAEAGVEEALAHLAFTNNMRSSGWALEGSRITKTRSLGSDHFKATIETNLQAKGVHQLDIISRGFVKLPLTETQYVSRAIRVTVTNTPLFQAALTVKQYLNLEGKNLRTDSFHSDSTAFSNGGRYDPSRYKDGGHIFSVAGIANPKPAQGSGKIVGKLKTGMGGSVTLGQAGAIGDRYWHNGGKTGIQPGWATNDMKITFPKFNAPLGAFPASGGTVNGVAYDYVLPSGKWIVDKLEGSVYVSGHASLTVKDTIYLNCGRDADGKLFWDRNNEHIVISKDASLKIFMKGKEAVFAGYGTVGVISNLTHRAESFQFFGRNTRMGITSPNEVVGLFYAPAAHTQLGQFNGKAPLDLKGALVVKQVHMDGDVNIHFDEQVTRIPSPIYKLASWEEL